MTRCPQGHESSTSDYCSICGTPMTQPLAGEQSGPNPASMQPSGSSGWPPSAARQVPTEPRPAPSAQTCPVCGSAAAADAFFCETCGYDFLTGSLPRSMARGGGGAAAEPPAAQAGPGPAPGQALAELVGEPQPGGGEPQLESQSEPAQAPPASPVTTFELSEVPTRAAADNPLVAEPAPQQRAAPPPAPAALLSLGEPERDLPNPDDLQPMEMPQQYGSQPRPRGTVPQPPAHSFHPEPARQPSAPPRWQPALTGTGPVAPAKQGPARWVAEIWIDPEWYRSQQAPEQLPSPGQPLVQSLRKQTIVIGRTSASGRPDLDCISDTGVSRRQAVLTTDGIRWFVEDLGSSNGTYIGQVDRPLPTEPISGRIELGPHDRIYVGSWTRIVVRPALMQEADL